MIAEMLKALISQRKTAKKLNAKWTKKDPVEDCKRLLSRVKAERNK